jgi:fatty acid desaturase
MNANERLGTQDLKQKTQILWFARGLSLLAAITTALFAVLAGVDPATLLWRVAVSVVAVWAFQALLLTAWESLDAEPATVSEPSRR